jgi:tetratricopeptide (TPR) repeat protein
LAKVVAADEVAMPYAKDQSMLRRVAESRWFLTVALGSPAAGVMIYVASLAAGEVRATDVVLALLLGFGGVHLIDRARGRSSESVGNLPYGLGRHFTPVEEQNMEWQDRIDKLERAGDYEQAVAARRHWLEAGQPPSRATQLFLIAQTYEERLKQPREALLWYRKTAALGPDGNSYYLEAKARADRLAKAWHTSDADHAAREAAIREQIEKEDFDAAARLAEDLTRHYPASAVGHFLRGVMASRRGNHAQAAAYYTQAVNQDPQHERAAFNLALALGKAHQYVEARRHWQVYLERFDAPDSPYAAQARAALEEIIEFLRTDLEEN